MLAATGLALAAAVLHAVWNLLVKTSDDRQLAAWGQYLVGGTLCLPVLLLTGVPTGVGGWLAASVALNVAYIAALVQAYHHGDFSMAYPLARGSGAVGAAVGAAIVLDDRLTAGSWVGVAIVGVGLASLLGRKVTAVSVGWALGTGACIATYSIVDAVGARASNGAGYGVALTFLSGLGLSVIGVAGGRGRDFARSFRTEWSRYVLSGVCLTGAYSLVLVAVSRPDVPVGYVSVLRESSIVIGAAAGWLLLGEALGGRRLVSSLVIAAGMGFLVALR